MTKKKRRPVKSIEKLSDDLKGHRALKGSRQRIPIAVATIDRWIQKAEALERRVDYWKELEDRQFVEKETAE